MAQAGIPACNFVCMLPAASVRIVAGIALLSFLSFGRTRIWILMLVVESEHVSNLVACCVTPIGSCEGPAKPHRWLRPVSPADVVSANIAPRRVACEGNAHECVSWIANLQMTICVILPGAACRIMGPTATCSEPSTCTRCRARAPAGQKHSNADDAFGIKYHMLAATVRQPPASSGV